MNGKVKRLSRSFQTVRPRFWVILFSALAVAMISLYASQQRYIDRQNETVAELESQRDALIAANQQIQDQIDFTYTDEFIEREARGKLGLVKGDETLYQSNETSGED